MIAGVQGARGGWEQLEAARADVRWPASRSNSTSITSTEAGVQLSSDWRLVVRVPGWSDFVAEVEQERRCTWSMSTRSSVREPVTTVYRQALDVYACHSGRTPLLVRDPTFEAAMIDLEQSGDRPGSAGASAQLIGRAGAFGSVNGFGELPDVGAELTDSDPAISHNRYPVEWARIAAAVERISGQGHAVLRPGRAFDNFQHRDALLARRPVGKLGRSRRHQTASSACCREDSPGSACRAPVGFVTLDLRLDRLDARCSARAPSCSMR